jgi:hypothetical protein
MVPNNSARRIRSVGDHEYVTYGNLSGVLLFYGLIFILLTD